MPYSITRYAEHMVWVVVEGYLTLPHAESYLHDMWSVLDASPASTDLLVDGRRIAGGAPGARRRTEQVAHHPNLGRLAFVVGEMHLLLFAPLVKLVSGVGLFGDEHEALDYLRAGRGLPGVADLGLPNLPPPPAGRSEPAHGHVELTHGHVEPPHSPRLSRHALPRTLPPRPTSRLKGTPIYPPEPRYGGEGRRAGSGDGEAE